MKKLYFIPLIILIMILGNTFNTFSQAPEGITYQAEARDSKGTLITNKSLTVEITIVTGSSKGRMVWQKDYNVTTDDYGLFTIIIGDLGTGTNLYGNFAGINWGSGTYFLNVKILWAKKWLDAGTSQLLSVPYALYSKSAGSAKTETDPVFKASPSYGITTMNTSNWNTAFSWGNHATAGYLKKYTETDPVWTAASANYYTKSNLQTSGASQVHFNNLTNKPTTLAGYGITDGSSNSWASLTGKPTTLSGYGITDAISTSHVANGITSTNISNWNAAYSWGNPAGLYRPISYVPAWSEITSNPFSFTSVQNNQLLKYNSTSGKWENWTPNFSSGSLETDPVWIAAEPNYYTKTNMQTSGGAQLHFNNLTNEPTTIAGYGITDAFDGTWISLTGKPTSLGGYGITDAISASHVANGITSTNISNWNTAYSWGDHAGLYRPADWAPVWNDVMGKPFRIDASPLNGDLLWFDAGIGRFINWTPDFLTSYTETDPIFSAKFDATGAASGDFLKHDGSKYVKYSPDFTQSNYLYNTKYGVKLLARNDAQTNVDFVLSPKGNGGILAQQPDGTAAGGNVRGTRAVDLQLLRSQASHVASGNSSIAIGTSNSASGAGASAIGSNNTASGGTATAIGNYLTASGLNSTAIGSNNTASGIYSFSAGYGNIASGTYSFSVGVGNIAQSFGETALGLYATIGSGNSSSYVGTDRLFVIGNGSATGASDAFSILKNGNTTVSGSLTINGNGTSYAFPTDRGASGQVLQTDGSGGTSWATPTGAGVTETDPVWTTASSNYYTRTNVQTSGGAQLHFNNLTNKPTTVSGYGITDAMTTAHAANGITSTNITNWNTAYGWGNHAGLYRPVTYVPVWGEIISNPFYFSSPENNQLIKFNSSSAKWENWTPNYLTSVTGTAPIVSSGGNTPAISISAATTSAAGSMSAADKTKLDDIPTLSIGQSYQGGIIFWLDDTGQHGLIAATADQSTGIQWYNGTNRYTGTTGDGLYAGAMNTAMIIATQMADNQTGNFAAKVCADYSVTVSGVTYGDWYLPSKYELNLLYAQKTAVGGFANASYWSSTEGDNAYAWGKYFNEDDQYESGKNFKYYVRAIRAF